jgi:spore maturation protein SpmB
MPMTHLVHKSALPTKLSRDFDGSAAAAAAQTTTPGSPQSNHSQTIKRKPTMADSSPYRRYNSPTERETKEKHRSEQRAQTTALHTACSSPSSSLSKLRATLLALGPSSASIRDEEGRLPLHLLGKNELLIHLFLNQARYEVDENDAGFTTGEVMMGGTGANRSPRTELDSFVVELVKAYPRGMICTTEDGRIPLTDAIYDWIEYSSRDVPLGRDGEEMEERGPSRLGMGSANGRDVSYLGSDRLEGMSQLMGRDEDDAVRNAGEVAEQSVQRSVLTGLSLPSAFKSAYSASSEVGSARGTRATYRNLLEDPAARQQAEFKNVWSATAPRAEEDEDERMEGGSGRGRSARSGRSGSRHASGQSDIVSNPPEDAAIDDVFPLNLAMPPVVEWSLRMISIILDGIESYGGPLGYDDSESFQAWKEGDKDGGNNTTSGDLAWIGNSIVSSVASIPSLMKTLLLLNDNDPAKSRVFHLSVIRRAISSKYTIGNWLVYMLEAVDPIVARRGVDYLEILSEDEDENALIPSTKRVRFAGTQLSPASRAALYYKVSRLDYFLPAILALEDTKEVDRAAKTKLLRHILDKELGSRATLTMAFFDVFFLIMLLVCFQMMVYNVVEGGGYSLKYVVTSYLSMTGVIYAVLRKFGQMSSMIKISKQAFAENNFRWEDAVDWLAILLAIGGIVWMELQTTLAFVQLTDYMRSYLAAAICALWFKLVSWLSVINWQVVNLVQVLYQVSYFWFHNADAFLRLVH